MAGSPTVRRRRLAAELRALREGNGLTIDEAARVTDISKSALSRIENALVGVKIPILRTLLFAYKVDEHRSEALIELAREAGQRGWWQAYGNVLSEQMAAYIGFEAEAATIRNYEPLVIPGILQTEEYVLAVMKAFTGPETKAEEVRRRIDARLKRQDRLKDLELWAIIDETTLLRNIGGSATMKGQLEHILELSSQANVTLQVLPLDAGAHPGLDGPFSLFRFDSESDPDIAYVESAAGEFWLDDAKDIRRLSRTFDHLRAAALDIRSTRDRITKIARDYK